MSQVSYRVGVDVGGTFTDIVFVGSDGSINVRKVPSTPPDYGTGICDGIAELLRELDFPASCIIEVVNGTTVVTNALLEMTGGTVGMITTRGFRDTLEFNQMRLVEPYDTTYQKPPPLIPRYLRLEVIERVTGTGEILEPLDIDSVDRAIETLLSFEVESVAVCLINSPHNSRHERLVGERLAQLAPDLLVSLSTEVMPMVGEIVRTSEVALNAYTMPIVATYFRRLAEGLHAIGVHAPLFVMESSGGMTTPAGATERSISIIEGGPAAGVVGASFLARHLDVEHAIVLDMGGTTTKASIIESGAYLRAREYEVGGSLHRSSLLLTGSGYPLRVPALDVAEVGSGGGSILYVDEGGLLHVGPQSAGAVPGPVCYNRGGTRPTLSDAYVALGYLNPEYLCGGGFPIDAAAAVTAIEEQLAGPLGIDADDAAYGACQVANAEMGRVIKAVSLVRGRDPRKFALLVSGGAGALHAASLARSLGMSSVIVAPYTGVFSALGLMFADVERHFVRARREVLQLDAAGPIEKTLADMEDEALASVARWGDSGASVEIDRLIDLRYVGQTTELTVKLTDRALDASHLRRVRSDFEDQHRITYEHVRPETELETVNLRVSARIPTVKPVMPDSTVAAASSPDDTSRKIGETRRIAYFGREFGRIETPVLAFSELGSTPRAGPLIIEKYDTTVVVPPDCMARSGEWETVLINLPVEDTSDVA